VVRSGPDLQAGPPPNKDNGVGMPGPLVQGPHALRPATGPKNKRLELFREEDVQLQWSSVTRAVSACNLQKPLSYMQGQSCTFSALCVQSLAAFAALCFLCLAICAVWQLMHEQLCKELDCASRGRPPGTLRALSTVLTLHPASLFSICRAQVCRTWAILAS